MVSLSEGKKGDRNLKEIRVINTSDLDTSPETPASETWYIWSICISTDPREFLSEIKEVVYHLHPTFPSREVHVKDRSTDFRFVARGWGEFTIGLEIVDKNDKKVKLSHELSLTGRKPLETIYKGDDIKFK